MLLLATNAVSAHTFPSPEANLHVTQGDSFSKQGKHENAIDEYCRAIKLDPDCDGPYFLLAGEYKALGQYRMVVETCDRLIELNPLNSLGFIQRAGAYFSLKRYDQAIRDYDQAIVLDPKSPANYLARASAYAQLQHQHQASNDFGQAVALRARSSADYLARGFAHIQRENYTEAIDDFGQCVALHARSYGGFLGLGLAYAGLEQNEKAIENYNEAILIEPKEYFLYLKRGMAYSALKQYQQAIDDFSRSIALAPNSSTPYFCRSKVYSELGQPAEANKDYKSAKLYATVYAAPSSIIPTLRDDIIGSYSDENVVIQAECQFGLEASPNAKPKDQKADLFLIVSVTNKGHSLIVEPDLSFTYVAISDDRGRSYDGAAPELVSNENETAAKPQIGPGETKRWKIRILESVARDARTLRVHIWDGEFGNKEPFNIAVYLASEKAQ